MKTGRTNDEVKAAPAATWSSTSLWVGPTRRRARRPRRPRQGRAVATRRTHAEADQPRQGAVPGAPAAPGADQARPDPPLRDDRAGDAAVPRRPAGQPAPLPRRHRQAGLLAQGGAVATPRTGSAAGATRTPTPARPSSTSSLDSPAALAWVGQLRRHRAAPVDVDGRRDPHQPTWAMIDIDPGTDSTFDDVLVLARLHRTALDHLGVQAMPKVTGKRGIQIWVPVAERLHVRRHPGVGRSAVAGHRRHGARAGQLGVGGRRSAAAGPGSTTRRTRSTRRSSPRSAPGRRRALRCRCRSRGTSSTIRTCVRTAGRSPTSASAWRRRATRSRR